MKNMQNEDIIVENMQNAIWSYVKPK